MDFSSERLDHQVSLDQTEFSLNLEGIDTTDYLIHQSATIAELNINRSYDDLLDVSTTYLGTDLVQKTDVFNAQPSNNLWLSHLWWITWSWKNGYPDRHRNLQKLHVQAFYMCHVHLHTTFLNFNLPLDICKLVMEL